MSRRIKSGKCPVGLVTQMSTITFSYVTKAISIFECSEKWVFGKEMEIVGIGNYFKMLNCSKH